MFTKRANSLHAPEVNTIYSLVYEKVSLRIDSLGGLVMDGLILKSCLDELEDSMYQFSVKEMRKMAIRYRMIERMVNGTDFGDNIKLETVKKIIAYNGGIR